MIFLDTNVVSETMRLRPSARVVDWISRNEADLALSSIVIGEIVFGIERIRPAERSPRLAAHLAAIRRQYRTRIHTFDAEAAVIYGFIMGGAVRNGQPLPVLDGMIAAIALKHDAVLATRNSTHFAVPGLRLIDPWA